MCPVFVLLHHSFLFPPFPSSLLSIFFCFSIFFLFFLCSCLPPLSPSVSATVPDNVLFFLMSSFPLFFFSLPVFISCFLMFSRIPFIPAGASLFPNEVRHEVAGFSLVFAGLDKNPAFAEMVKPIMEHQRSCSTKLEHKGKTRTVRSQRSTNKRAHQFLG